MRKTLLVATVAAGAATALAVGTLTPSAQGAAVNGTQLANGFALANGLKLGNGFQLSNGLVLANRPTRAGDADAPGLSLGGVVLPE